MLCPDNMSDKVVGVLGLGRSGMAAAASLGAGGAQLYLHDDTAQDHESIPAGATVCDWQEWPWATMDMMVISPGIPHHHPAPHPAAAMARTHGVAIISEIEIAIQAKPAAQIVAITGTNGKSTTTALIGHCLAQAGRAVAVGGNIGDAACGLADPGPQGVIVLELSSYQLETTPSLMVDCAVVLNITPDHLDRHNGMAGYVAAKGRIIDAIRPDGLAVLGTSDSYVTAFGAKAKQRGINHIMAAPTMAPAAHRDCPALAGAHNAENAAIAGQVLAFLGLDEAQIAAGMQSFDGLPHRMQQVAAISDIVFVDDSKATNGVAAAKSLAAFDNIYWIAGGMAKEDGLGAAGDALQAVSAAYLIGASGPDFAAALEARDDLAFPVTVCGDMDRATNAAFDDAAAAGGSATILLAPAAASFDQFDSFVDRGNAFAAIARAIAAPRPAPSADRGGLHA